MAWLLSPLPSAHFLFLPLQLYHHEHTSLVPFAILTHMFLVELFPSSFHIKYRGRVPVLFLVMVCPGAVVCHVYGGVAVGSRKNDLFLTYLYCASASKQQISD